MLTSGSSNHNQNRYQAVVSSGATFLCVIIEVESVCFSPARASRLSHSAVVFPPAPYRRRPDNITIFPFCNLVA